MKTISIDANRVAEIQIAHAEVDVLQDTMNMYIESHSKDINPVENSTSIDTLTRKLAEKKLVFENLKTKLVKDYLGENASVNWQLDYGTNILTYSDNS